MNPRERLEGVRRRANFAFVEGETPFASHLRAIYDSLKVLAECQLQPEEPSTEVDETDPPKVRLLGIENGWHEGRYPSLEDMSWLIRQARKLVNPLQHASNEELFKELAERMNER